MCVANGEPVTQRRFDHGGGHARSGAEIGQHAEKGRGVVRLGEEGDPLQRGFAVGGDGEIFAVINREWLDARGGV